MKNDINNILGKLIAFSRDNLMLDALDERYTLNRLAALGGVADPGGVDIFADYGDSTLPGLISELKAVAPNVDAAAVVDILFPLAHNVNYYFTDTLSRNPKKAFSFLFELCALGGCAADGPARVTSDGFARFPAYTPICRRSLILDVDGDAKFTPLATPNFIAELLADDILVAEIVRRETTFVGEYGYGIVARPGAGGVYNTFADCAVERAPVKTVLVDGAAKLSLLDYAVPAIAVEGIAKNTVAAAATKLASAAVAADLPCVIAAAPKPDGVAYYVIFAKPTEGSADGLIKPGDALSTCGVFETADCSALVPVLEKGTALSADLAAFKSIYNDIGGVKLGANAETKLTESLASSFKKLLSAAASADEATATALVG